MFSSSPKNLASAVGARLLFSAPLPFLWEALCEDILVSLAPLSPALELSSLSAFQVLGFPGLLPFGSSAPSAPRLPRSSALRRGSCFRHSGSRLSNSPCGPSPLPFRSPRLLRSSSLRRGTELCRSSVQPRSGSCFRPLPRSSAWHRTLSQLLVCRRWLSLLASLSILLPATCRLLKSSSLRRGTELCRSSVQPRSGSCFRPLPRFSAWHRNLPQFLVCRPWLYRNLSQLLVCWRWLSLLVFLSILLPATCRVRRPGLHRDLPQFLLCRHRLMGTTGSFLLASAAPQLSGSRRRMLLLCLLSILLPSVTPDLVVSWIAVASSSL